MNVKQDPPRDIRDQIGPPPSVPPGFFGEITYHFKDGAVVLVDVKQTFKP